MASRAEPRRNCLGTALLMLSLAAGGCGAVREAAVRDGPPDPEAGLPKGGFAWPADGRVTSSFGRCGHTNHDGIDIAAAQGTPVRAAADGMVIFASALRGYGNVIIVEHRIGLTTVYAHNQENRAQVGHRVRRGDVIATVGQTGKTTGPNLHFEVRRNKLARDPLAYLPARRPSLMAQQQAPSSKSVGVGG